MTSAEGVGLGSHCPGPSGAEGEVPTWEAPGLLLQGPPHGHPPRVQAVPTAACQEAHLMPTNSKQFSSKCLEQK